LAADRSATQATKEARDDRAFYLVALMAAIVATLAYIPVGALVAFLAFVLYAAACVKT
jgi:hypothetical protein